MKFLARIVSFFAGLAIDREEHPLPTGKQARSYVYDTSFSDPCKCKGD